MVARAHEGPISNGDKCSLMTIRPDVKQKEIMAHACTSIWYGGVHWDYVLL